MQSVIILSYWEHPFEVMSMSDAPIHLPIFYSFPPTLAMTSSSGSSCCSAQSTTKSVVNGRIWKSYQFSDLKFHPLSLKG